MAKENELSKKDVQKAEPVESLPTFEPQVDIVGKSGSLVILADMPGVRKEDVEVVLESGTLTISAEVHPSQYEGMEIQRQEYDVGNYQRHFRLGEGLDDEKVQAVIKNGVLCLTIPKSTKYTSRRIEIKSE